MDIENQKTSIKTTVVIAIAVGSFFTAALTSYFAAMMGVKDGFTALRLEMKDYDKRLELQSMRMDQISNDVRTNYEIFIDYREAMKPEKPELEFNHKNRRR